MRRWGTVTKSAHTMYSRTARRLVSLRLATKVEGLGALTFSRPKNLSLPSSRRGPAFSSILSRGVSSAAGSSFLPFGDALLSVFELPYNHELVKSLPQSPGAGGRTKFNGAGGPARCDQLTYSSRPLHDILEEPRHGVRMKRWRRDGHRNRISALRVYCTPAQA